MVNFDARFLVPSICNHFLVNIRVGLDDGMGAWVVRLDRRVDQPKPKADVQNVALGAAHKLSMGLLHTSNQAGAEAQFIAKRRGSGREKKQSKTKTVATMHRIVRLHGFRWDLVTRCFAQAWVDRTSMIGFSHIIITPRFSSSTRSPSLYLQTAGNEKKKKEKGEGSGEGRGKKHGGEEKAGK